MLYSLLFTGHMIDAEDRAIPRFPKYKEAAVRQAIHAHLLKEKEQHTDLRAIAGGACGSDMIFHELCIELAIPSVICLALPVEAFIQTSVAFAGKEWEDRFYQLIKAVPVHILPPAADAGSIWEKVNEWMLAEALLNGGMNMTLIAVWNGSGGDGPGGTGHMVNAVKAQGGGVKIIDMNAVGNSLKS